MAPPGLLESRRGTSYGPPVKSIDQITRELDAARGRKEFFSNRPDVSDDRALRRMRQFDEMRSFQNNLIDSGRVLMGERADGTKYVVQNPNTGGPVYLSSTPQFDRGLGQYTSTTVADKAQQLANQYGPTGKEIMSDIGFATKSMMSGLAKLPGQALEMYKEISPVSKVMQGIESFFKGPSQMEAEQEQATGSIPTQSETVSDAQKTSSQLSSMEGASPEFLAAINNPMTMAREFNLERLLNQAQKIKDLGNTPIGNFGIDNFRNPTFTFDRPLGEGQINMGYNPSQNLFDIGYTMTFANGGVANL